MPRRLHTVDLHTGLVALDAAQLRHARQVLRLKDGDEVELFDNAGRTAAARVEVNAEGRFEVRASEVRQVNSGASVTWRVAAAVPKGERADWMVEKLSELGCAAYTPLIAERSVVQPKGSGKHDRWVRLATESAKQCRRAGVMRIGAPMSLDQALAETPQGAGWFLDTGPTAVPIRRLLTAPLAMKHLSLFIGPEGGWTIGEVDRMLEARLVGVGLTRTTLRIETAALAAAALVAAMTADD